MDDNSSHILLQWHSPISMHIYIFIRHVLSNNSSHTSSNHHAYNMHIHQVDRVCNNSPYACPNLLDRKWSTHKILLSPNKIGNRNSPLIFEQCSAQQVKPGRLFFCVHRSEGFCTVTLPIPVLRWDYYVSNNAIMHMFPNKWLFQKALHRSLLIKTGIAVYSTKPLPVVYN